MQLYIYQVGDMWLPDCGVMSPVEVLNVNDQNSHGITYVTVRNLDNGRVFTWTQFKVQEPASTGSPRLLTRVPHPYWGWNSDLQEWEEIKYVD